MMEQTVDKVARQCTIYSSVLLTLYWMIYLVRLSVTMKQFLAITNDVIVSVSKYH